MTVALEYMKEEQSIEEFKEFKKDVMGQQLRYKIIVANEKVLTVLYNMGQQIIEIPFVETQFTTNQFGNDIYLFIYIYIYSIIQDRELSEYDGTNRISTT